MGKEALRLRKSASITVGSCDAIFEAAHLNLVTAFEALVEDLFFSLLLGTSGIDDAVPRVTFSDRAAAEHVLVGDREYIDWLPFKSHTMRISSQYFSNSPFGRLTGHASESETLSRITIVRNRIAHDSGKARKQFAPLAADLRPRRRTPAGHLQQPQQGMTTLEQYALELQKIALALTEPTTAAAKQLLSAESPKQQGSKPGPGNYECTRCRNPTKLGPRKDTLPGCAKCHSAGARSKSTWRRLY
jgi:hypothetical protein